MNYVSLLNSIYPIFCSFAPFPFFSIGVRGCSIAIWPNGTERLAWSAWPGFCSCRSEGGKNGTRMHEKGKDRATPATCQDDASLQEELKGSFSLENGWGLYYSCHEHCRVVPLYGMHMFSIFFL